MKFVLDKRTGQYIPENLLQRSEEPEIKKAVYSWLDSSPYIAKKFSFSTRSIAYEFFRTHKMYAGGDIELVRDAVAQWYNKNREIADSATEAADHLVDWERDDKLITVEGIPVRVYKNAFTNTTSNTLGGGTRHYTVGFDVDGSAFASYYFEPKRRDEIYDSIPNRFKTIEDFMVRLKEIYDTEPDTSAVYNIQHIQEKLAAKKSSFATEDAGACAASAGAAGIGPQTAGVPQSGTIASVSCPELHKKKKKKAQEAINIEDVPEENKRGDCYRQAWYAFYDNIKDNPRLCHGIIVGQGPIEGIKYNHAWVEVGDMVIDRTIPLFANGFPKGAYYNLAHADEKLIFKYDSKQIAEMVEKWGTFGPWEDILWQYP